MAWTYYCADENLSLSAPTKEQLAVVVLEHVKDMHGKEDMTLDQVRQMVAENAKEQAA